MRSSGLWEVYTQTCPKWDNFFITALRVPFHDSRPSFMNFRRVLDLLEFKSQVSQRFAGNQQCPGVWNSFSFLVWDLSMHPRTSMVVDLSFFLVLVDAMRQIWVQGSTGTSLDRRATATCALLLAAGLFIDSQSLVGDGASLDLAMVEAWRLFWRCWIWAAAAGFSVCRKT